jgi:hypothetical protein
MKARNSRGQETGSRDDTLGLLINKALSPESRAYIREGLPKCQKNQHPTQSEASTDEGGELRKFLRKI